MEIVSNVLWSILAASLGLVACFFGYRTRKKSKANAIYLYCIGGLAFIAVLANSSEKILLDNKRLLYVSGLGPFEHEQEITFQEFRSVSIVRKFDSRGDSQIQFVFETATGEQEILKGSLVTENIKLLSEEIKRSGIMLFDRRE